MKAYCSCPRPKDYVCPVDCERREDYKITGYTTLSEIIRKAVSS